MPEPAIDFGFAIMLLENCNNILHRTIGLSPSVEDIRKIDAAVFTFLFVIKTKRAPKRFNVSEHLRTKRPNARHPVAIQTPN